MKCSSKTVVALLGACAFTCATHAGVKIDVQEVAGDVVFTVTGTLDLTGATFGGFVGYSAGLIPGGDNWYIAMGDNDRVDTYALTSAEFPFGTDTDFNQSYSSDTGSDFMITGVNGGTPVLGVPGGYISGDAISSEMVFSSTTIAGLTLIPGSYEFGLPNDTITLNIVPAPGAFALLGIAGLTARRRRRN